VTILKDGNEKVLDDLTLPEVAAVKTMKFLFFHNEGKKYLVPCTKLP
jgi:hypothetical protein